MFCDTCHWYTRGEPICPHCGAPQSPKEGDDIFSPPKAEAMPAAVFEEPPPPKPIPAPVSIPAPKLVYSAPKPAPPPPGGNKQGFKALAFVLVGVVALVFVLFLVDAGRDDTNYYLNPVYDDSFNGDSYFFEDITEPPLEEAQPGDVLTFGNARWRVLEKDEFGALLLLEYDIYLQPEEIAGYLNKVEMYEMYSDVVSLGGVEFAAEEFGRIRQTPDGGYMLRLSPEEMEAYGVETPEIWDEEAIPVRPAIWVNIWEDGR